MHQRSQLGPTDQPIGFLNVVWGGVGFWGQKMRVGRALEMSEYYMWSYFTFAKWKVTGENGKVVLLDYIACWIIVPPFQL